MLSKGEGAIEFAPTREKISFAAFYRILLLLILVLVARSRADDESPWDWSMSLRGGGGYKDNVLLGPLNTEQSAFTFTELEAFLFRIPLNDGWEFNGFVSLEDRRYWQSASVNHEDAVITSAEVKKRFWERWKAGFNAQYFFSDQVFDVSVLENEPLRLPATLHQFSGGPSLQLDLPHRETIEARFNLTRQEFQFPIDSSWEMGPKITFTQKFSTNSEAWLMSQLRHRSYDTREASDRPFKTLEFNVPEVEIGVKHYWDSAKVWRSRLRGAVEWDLENGSGLLNYRRWRLSKDLAFTKGGFEATLSAKFLHYEYENQFVDDRARRRTELDFGGRVKKDLMKHLNAFIEGEYEWVLATDELERYRAMTIWGGLEWEIK